MKIRNKQAFHSLHFIVCILVMLLLDNSSRAQINRHIYDNWVDKFGGGINVGSDTAFQTVKFERNWWTFQQGISVSDVSGNLLFYGAADQIFNRKYLPMKNSGGSDSVEDILLGMTAIPIPGIPGQYKIYKILKRHRSYNMEFDSGMSLFEYTINMNGDGRLGEIVGEKKFIMKDLCTALTAVYDTANGSYWIIVRPSDKQGFISFHVSNMGAMDTSPVYSPIYFDSAYQMRLSNQIHSFLKTNVQGTRIVFSMAFTGILELYDFDINTGKITENMYFHLGQSENGDVAFSLSGKYLYAFAAHSYPYWGYCDLFQFNLNEKDSIAIKKSAAKKYNIEAGGLQLAPNGKLYTFVTNSSNSGENYVLASFTDPDKIGLRPIIDTALKFHFNVFSFPNIISQFLVDVPALIAVEDTCENLATRFLLANAANDAKVSWDFGDGKTDTGVQVFHTFSQLGKYIVKADYNSNTLIGSKSRTIEILPALQPINLGNDTISFALLTLNVGPQANLRGAQVIWSTGDTGNHQITVTKTGKYWVRLMAPGYCSPVTDSIYILLLDKSANISDTITCVNSIMQHKVNLPDGVTALWNGKLKADSFATKTSGKYWLNINYGGAKYVDSFNWQLLSIPTSSGIFDTTICSGTILQLTVANVPGSSVLWSTGDTVSSVIITDSGSYSVIQSFGECTSKINFKVRFPSFEPMFVGGPYSICTDEGRTVSLQLRRPDKNATYTWTKDGSHAESLIANSPGWYSVRLSMPGGCSFLDSIFVDEYCKPLIEFPNAFSPDGDGLNDEWLPASLYIQYYDCVIYNRWGEQVWQGNDPHKGWNGNFKGAIAPDGIYIYTLWYRGEKRNYNDLEFKRGVINLFRHRP